MHAMDGPYLLFKSQKNTWILTVCAVLGIVLGLRNLLVQAPPIVFTSVGGRYAAYAFEVLSTVVLIRWIAKSKSASEKVFIACWLLAWMMGWVAPFLSASEMQMDRWATIVLWVIATAACVRIFGERKAIAQASAAGA